MARHLCEDKSRNMVVSSSSAGFCYSDVSSSNPNNIQAHMGNPIHGYETNPEIFNLTTGMEMIGFSRNLQQQQHHDRDEDDDDQFSNKHDFTIGISETSSENHNHHHNLIVGHDSWNQEQQNRLLVDDSSIRCVFPCEGNERPSQGLSLSLSSTNPSTIGLQSFELRHTNSHQNHQEELRFLNSSSSSRDGFFGKSAMMQDNDHYLPKPNLQHHQNQGQQFQARNSKYLAAVQELLNEFCSLGTRQINDQQKPQKRKNWDDENSTSTNSSSSRKQSLCSLEFMELQKRKSKLLSMLEEVDRRYRHYCDQMKAVVASFEGVAGAGAATVYLSLASKAMSRHFRCLKDGILGQIYATKKAMGEKDPIAPGTTRGETPRLKVLDQTLRQQRAIQQMTMMETHPWRPQRGLPERSVSVLRAWLFEHFLHPYPSDVDKHILARQTGLSRSQVSNWFINARVRLWKPMIEEMYTEEAKDQEHNNMTAGASSDGMTDLEDTINHMNTTTSDQKPTADQLLRIDSECLSSIISSNPDKNDTSKIFGSAAFGAVELDFSSYNHHTGTGGVSYATHHNHHNHGGFNGGGVSLTLGLQQHGESGVSLAFSPASQSSLFYPRDHIDECQAVQYSILDGEAQNLPYRNLMGAQLLHDLAG
ncbi:homeobox protein BEL1 homolog [Euphorbia lathyris]|uniref:homeobox protein BEL1 homolog n=1 Tax=Euphorbia lathyris TaxID=212925 RepID=UPI003313FEDA